MVFPKKNPALLSGGRGACLIEIWVQALWGVRRSFRRVRRVRRRHSPAVRICAMTALHHTPVCPQNAGRMKSRTSMSAGSEYTER